jgi:hypothetical protein
MFIAVMRNYAEVSEKLLEIPDSAHGGAFGYNGILPSEVAIQVIYACMSLFFLLYTRLMPVRCNGNKTIF